MINCNKVTTDIYQSVGLLPTHRSNVDTDQKYFFSINDEILAFSCWFHNQTFSDSDSFSIKIRDNDPFIKKMKEFVDNISHDQEIDYEKDFLKVKSNKYFLPLVFAKYEDEIRSKIYFHNANKQEKQSINPSWKNINEVTKGKPVNIHLIFSPVLCKEGKEVMILNEVVGINIYEIDTSNKIISYYNVNKAVENDNLKVIKNSDRNGFERFMFILNRKPLVIKTLDFNYQCFSKESPYETTNFIFDIPDSDTRQCVIDLKENLKFPEKNEFFKEYFEVYFNFSPYDQKYKVFIDEMNTLSQSIKESFDKSFNCQTENDIIKRINKQDNLYPHQFKFRSLFHNNIFGENKTQVYFIKNGQRIKIDASIENFYRETEGKNVTVKFAFCPFVYSKDNKYYLKNEVMYIEFHKKNRLNTD